jgi:hypothetical protein
MHLSVVTILCSFVGINRTLPFVLAELRLAFLEANAQCGEVWNLVVADQTLKLAQ